MKKLCYVMFLLIKKYIFFYSNTIDVILILIIRSVILLFYDGNFNLYFVEQIFSDVIYKNNFQYKYHIIIMLMLMKSTVNKS